MSLELKLVNNISNHEKYRKYSEKGVFLITHPGFYPYFSFMHANDKRSAIEEIVKGNFDEAKLQSEHVAMKNFVTVFQTLKEMTFFECLRSYGNLTVMLLPKDYKTASFDGAGYGKYLEQITCNQENFVSLQSFRHNSGRFNHGDGDSLLRMFRAIGVHHVYLGGGYVDRCQKASNEDLVDMVDMITLVPEASTVHSMPLTKKLLGYKLKSRMLLNSVSQGHRKVVEAVYSHKGLCNEIIERTKYWLFKQATSFYRINMKTIIPDSRLVHPSVRMFYEKAGF